MVTFFYFLRFIIKNKTLNVMIDLSFKIKRVTIIVRVGTDIISLYPELDTPFPEMKYPPVLKMDVRKGYGFEYCKNILNINEELIEVIKI